MSQPVIPEDFQRWQHLAEAWGAAHPCTVLCCRQCGTPLQEASRLRACGGCLALLCARCHCPCTATGVQEDGIPAP